MIAHLVSRSALSVAIVLLLASTGVAQPPPGYRVYTWGYFDRFPYPPPIGSSVIYSSGPPVISYVDPRGRVVDMPLRPKVLYGSTPFMTPDGFHYPTSIVVISDPGRRPVSYKVGPAVPAPKQTAEPMPLIPKARNLDTPPPEPALPPTRKPAAALPPIPKLPALPKTPLPPGVPNLGPASAELTPPVRK